jgi:hypothetical protein
MGRRACTEPQCLYSRAIPLLPLWAVRPLQSLSACTVELYLYSPYGPYGLYRTSVPIQGCILSFLPWAYIRTKPCSMQPLPLCNAARTAGVSVARRLIYSATRRLIYSATRRPIYSAKRRPIHSTTFSHVNHLLLPPVPLATKSECKLGFCTSKH